MTNCRGCGAHITVGPRCEQCTLAAIADDVRELTQQHQHTEDYVIRAGRNRVPLTRQHTAWHAPLYEQLRDAAQRPGAVPVVRLDAINLGRRIVDDLITWQYRCHGSVRQFHRGEDWTLASLRQLVGDATALSTRNQRRLAGDVHRWWTWCRVIGGWQDWPPRIDAPCPQCGSAGTLRIRLDRSAAYCATRDCDAAWDVDSIGVLARHITEHDHARRADQDGHAGQETA